jgi:D-alanyl-D-alanine carboxypeptidase
VVWSLTGRGRRYPADHQPRRACRLLCCWLAVAVLAVAVLAGCTGNSAAGAPRGAGSVPPTVSRAALVATLRGELSRYLAARRQAEHISAVALTVTFRGSEPAISLAAGTTRYGGGGPVPPDALWQIGSNTKAFTAVLLLQLEAEGKLSITDTVGKWLPQYPAWRDITIRQLLDMTSDIPDYLGQPAFLGAVAGAPGTSFPPARLVAYVAGGVTGDVWNYSNTNYILAQMIIQKVTHDTYADQLTRRIIIPLRLHSLCDAPYTCPAADAARMPAGYFFDTTVSDQEPPSPLASLLGRPVSPLALSFAQGAGGIVSSLPDMAAWDRALYQGQLLPRAQQRQLESLVSETTGQPISAPAPAGTSGYGLGVQQTTAPATGTVWDYEGSVFGYRVLHLYFPRSGIIIALAANSDTAPDQNKLDALALSVYQTLQKAGATRTGATP